MKLMLWEYNSLVMHREVHLQLNWRVQKFPRPVKSSVNRKRGAITYFHVRFQGALNIHKRPFFFQKDSIVLGNRSSFDGSTLVPTASIKGVWYLDGSTVGTDNAWPTPIMVGTQTVEKEITVEEWVVNKDHAWPTQSVADTPHCI